MTENGPGTAEDIVLLSGLPELQEGDGKNLELALRNLGGMAGNLDNVGRLTLRELAIQILSEKKFRSPAKLIDAVLTGTEKKEGGQGEEIAFQIPDPWPDPVDGEELYREVRRFLDRFLVLPAGAAEAISIWIIATWFVTVFWIVPYLFIRSPTRECGKSRVLEILQLLSRKAFTTIAASEAAMFRICHSEEPTLILDESEGLRNKKSERAQALTTILNAGYQRGPGVPRCEGDSNTVRFFHVFGFKALAAIGRISDTVEGRSVIVNMQRKARTDTVERFRQKHAIVDAKDIARRLRRWSEDHMIAVESSEPELPDFLGDREQDIWEPLLQVAITISTETYQELIEAAKSLHGETQEDSDRNIQLIRDLKGVFAEQEAVHSGEICAALAKMEDRPWAEYRSGKSVTQNQLAAMLRDFKRPDGQPIKPEQIKIDGVNKRGYQRAWFTQLWETYCLRETLPSEEPPSEPIQPLQPSNDGLFSDSQERYRESESSTHEIDGNRIKQGIVAPVSDEQGVSERGKDNSPEDPIDEDSEEWGLA